MMTANRETEVTEGTVTHGATNERRETGVLVGWPLAGRRASRRSAVRRQAIFSALPLFPRFSVRSRYLCLLRFVTSAVIKQGKLAGNDCHESHENTTATKRKSIPRVNDAL
jgi:hypothetical protein